MRTTSLYRSAAALAFTVLLGGVLSAQGTQTPQTTTQQQGWVMYHDSIGQALRLTEQQMNDWRALDKRYDTQYRALGTNPMQNPDYRDLTNRRNADLRGILGEDLYNRWDKRYNSTDIQKPMGAPNAPRRPMKLDPNK